MNDKQPSIKPRPSTSAEQQISKVCELFESAWRSEAAPAIDDYLLHVEDPDNSALLRRLLLIDLTHRSRKGETIERERYHILFPDHVELINSIFAGASTHGVLDETVDLVPVDPDVTRSVDTAGELASTEAGLQGRESRAVQLSDVPEIPGYQVLDLLGRGGMGLVVKARDNVLKRVVAIKMPIRAQATGTDEHERFLREARSAAGLRHPHICPIYEVGETPGRPYLVMGFIEGQSLAEWAKHQGVSPRGVAEVTAILARAVSYAHQHDLVHRDIKPANVMIDAETGKPVLMDFGLAKNLAEEDVHLTQSGQVMGTPVYMAPEQAAGHTEQIGPPADIYALGVVLYELLCNQRPFRGSFGEVLKQVQTSEPTPPRRVKPGLHRDLETICLKAIAKEPSRRYESAAALAEDLERFCAGKAILARRELVLSTVARKIRRNPLIAASAAAVVVAVVVVALLASRYTTVQRTAVVARDVDGHLKAPRLDEAFLQVGDEKIAELRRLAPDQADDAQRRLNQQFESAIRDELRRPTLPPQEIARIATAIDLLADRNADLAEPLRKALAQRERNWQPIFRVAAPYSNATEVFAAECITLDSERLVLKTQAKSKRITESVLTNQECNGNVELHAAFPPGWSSAAEVGLILNGSEQGGYRFILRSVNLTMIKQDDKSLEDVSFEAAQRHAGQVSLAIYRGNTLLTEERRSGRLLGEGTLHLEVRREANWLTFQVGDDRPLRFRDIFSTSSRDPGVFGLIWPVNVPLESLQGYRQTLPTTTSSLEQGDELYLLGRFSEARDLYRRQAIVSANTPTAKEAQYKEALCLLALQRDDEAAKQFESVVTGGNSETADNEGDWPLLAACRLWLLRLQQRRGDDADAVYQSLSARYRFDELAGMVPEVLRRDIIQQYHSSGSGINLLTFNPDRIRDLERAIQVERFLRVPEISHVHTKRSLVRAYRMAGQIDNAIRFAEDVVSSELLDEMSSGDNFVEEYSWLMRLHGDSKRALREVDRRLLESPGVYREEFAHLLVERARIHASLEQWDNAENDIDDFFRLSEKVNVGYHYFSAASLIRGFLRERHGDASGSIEAWRVGREAADDNESAAFRSFAGAGSRMAQLNYIMLAALSDTLTDAEAESLVHDAFKSQATGTVGALFQSAVKIPPSLVRNMWRTPRGHKAAQQLAFQTVTFAEYVQLPVLVAGHQYVYQNAFVGELAPEDDKVIWDLAKQMLASHKDGRISATNLLQLGLTWKGTTNAFGWDGVQVSLEPELRASMAYVLGHRYQRLGRPADAADFFQVAVKDAAVDSLVNSRAQAQLAKLDENR